MCALASGSSTGTTRGIRIKWLRTALSLRTSDISCNKLRNKQNRISCLVLSTGRGPAEDRREGPAIQALLRMEVNPDYTGPWGAEMSAGPSLGRRAKRRMRNRKGPASHLGRIFGNNCARCVLAWIERAGVPHRL